MIYYFYKLVFRLNFTVGVKMDTRYYRVTKIDGEYATLTDIDTGDEIFIALFLLPEGTDLGTKLKYEMLEYEIID